MDPHLIDRIYECAFAPELWPGVLDEFADITDSRGGLMIAVNMEAGIPYWTASAGVRGNVQTYVRGGYFGRCLATERLLEFGRVGFISDHEVMTREEMEGDPLYNELLWPNGLGAPAGTTILSPTGDLLMCIVVRDRSQGPLGSSSLQKLDVLRPHFARSALMSARLCLERARAVTETLNLLGLPALVFDFSGQVIAANALIEAESRHVRWRARDRVALVDKAAGALFQRAVESIDDDEHPVPRSFAVRDADQVAAKVAHVVPIRGASRDIFARSAGVLMLTPVALAKAPAVELVQSLFDLTPAEAGVARGLTSGQTLQRIARESHVSPNTVRTHLRAVLEKTGCSRQAEVVALLSGLATPGA
jgi:DNA-binding CsgD family transcriptional regulator